MPDFTVLHLCSWYPTPFRPEHGIFHRSHIMAASLFTKHVVIYVSFSNAINKKQEYFFNNKNFHEYITILPKKKGFFHNLGKIFNWIGAYNKNLNKILKTHPDVRLVHLHAVFPAGLVYLLFGKIRKLPLIVSEQWSGYFPEDGNYKGIFRVWITKKIFDKCQKVLVGSDKLGKRLIELGLVNNYIFMENVLPKYFFQNYKKREKKDSILHFLHVSSLTEREKNITGMLNVFLKLKLKGSYDFTITIVGGNQEEVNYYRNWTIRYGLDDKVNFEGKKLNHELPEIYQNADIFVLFSHFESQPVVVLEAWAMGVPVLCTPVGQLPEWMRPEFGACAKSGNEEDLLELVLRAPEIIKHTDANEMRRFIKENFSEEVVGNKLHKIYNKVIFGI